MKYELRSIPVWPFVRISFFVNLVVGFLIGLLYALFFGAFMSVLSNLPGAYKQDPMDAVPVGFLMVILPIGFAVFGAVFNTILGVIVLFCYNAASKMVGGLELELRQPAVPGAPQYGGQTSNYVNTAINSWQPQPTVTPPMHPQTPPPQRPQPPQNPPSEPPPDYNI